MKKLCTAVAAILVVAASSSTAATIDVDNLLIPGSIPNGASGFSANSYVSPDLQFDGYAAQTWTVGRTGRLAMVDLVSSALGRTSPDLISFEDSTFQVTLSILSGATENSPGEILLGSVTRRSSEVVRDGLTSFDFSSQDILVGAGELLTWKMSVEDCPQVTFCHNSWVNPDIFVGIGDTDGYEGGRAYTRSNSGAFSWGDRDMNFRTWMATVPEPSTWALMIIGFGMGGVTLRGRQPVLAR